MNKSELARNLGISRQMVYKHEKRGMPTTSLEAAQAWRGSMFNVEPTQTKAWRIDGNSGKKREAPQVTARDFDKLQDVDIDSVLNDVDIDSELKQLSNNLEHETISKILTHVVPELWFEQAGWLGAALRDQGIKITAEQLLKVQSRLYLVYMDEVIEYLEEDDNVKFHIGPVLNAEPGDEIFPSLIARLNQILNEKTTR